MNLNPQCVVLDGLTQQRSSSFKQPRNIFAEARERYTIADIWNAFGFAGVPKSSCKSPFREDRTPSFSIFDDGRAFADHATSEGGDVIEFARHHAGR